MSSQKKLEDEIIKEFGEAFATTSGDATTTKPTRPARPTAVGVPGMETDLKEEEELPGQGDILQEMFDRHEANTDAQKKFDDMVRLQ
mmetsp:Transcript_4325/g.6314  ORF Transcript_4325/g.6314 Transcript_4325/m.6314 type:complete len:87 (-) Transcript_4325:350-610(-)